ncbi:MAG TPA: hypothetical protein VF173_06110 [Thermoanaerobaculia bacterium]|nr:hypothetical protein [Thermoanaerobaculia bacterium]
MAKQCTVRDEIRRDLAGEPEIKTRHGWSDPAGSSSEAADD